MYWWIYWDASAMELWQKVSVIIVAFCWLTVESTGTIPRSKNVDNIVDMKQAILPPHSLDYFVSILYYTIV